MKTPVALLIFKRPDTTEKVFDVIRQVKPPKLLVVADGPRTDQPGEAEKCVATRAIIDRVDWDCEVLKNYSGINLGYGLRQATGISWVFDQVETAIILEDDILPHPTFFRFCEELLEKHRHDERIMHISATNPLLGYKATEDSYYFSRQVIPWGWASWRRAFCNFDYKITKWPTMRDGNYLNNIIDQKRHVKYWRRIFEEIYISDKPYRWDYQWLFACWFQSGLSIIPSVNLASNLGFGHVDATTMTSAETEYANMPIEPITFPLKHPQLMVRNTKADIFIDNNFYNPSLITRAKAKIKRSINRFC